MNLEKVVAKLSILIAAIVSLTSLFTNVAAAEESSQPGASLRATVEDRDGDRQILDLPLKETRVDADISGFLAEVEVQQTFVNNHDKPLEAVYTFPLPSDASVHEMFMKIDDRIIVGQLKEEQEARETYEKAKEKGKAASLLEQERPNVFTQSVANIMPGDKVQIVTRYSEQLSYGGGEYTMVVPSVVAPRYTPGNPKARPSSGRGFSPDTDRVEDASRVTPKVKSKDVPTDHELRMNVDVNAGFPISSVDSPSHNLDVERPGENQAGIQLASGTAIPNRDFVLKYGLEVEQPKATTTYHRSSLGSFVNLIVQPQTEFTEDDIMPKDVVFVLDRSSSMSGRRFEMLQQSVSSAISNLRPRDRFELVTFANSARVWRHGLAKTTSDMRRKGRRWINSKEPGGGTEMLRGLRASLANRGSQSDGRLKVFFFVTDGQISNEREIFREVKSNLGDARLFTLGIGSSPNRYILDEMASLGRGESLFAQFDQKPGKVIDEFFSKISNPYLVDLKLKDPSGAFEDVMPKPLPDLFVEEPLSVTARCTEPGSHQIALEGKLGDEPWRQQLTLDCPKKPRGPKSIAQLWARRKIQDLMRESYGNPDEKIRNEIVKTSKEYSVMSNYTSFVAVEKRLVRNPNPDQLKSVAQAVELPEGMQQKGVETAIVDPGELEKSLVEASSTRKRSKPGDPLLSVEAPRGARDVVAYFPGHGRRLLKYNAEDGAWQARFVLPRDYQDRVYTVTVKVVLLNGDIKWQTVDVVVDSLAPEVSVEHLNSSGDTHRLRIQPQDVERLRRQPADYIEVELDIRRIRVTLPDGSWVVRQFRHLEERPDGSFVLGFEYDASVAGPFDVGIEAMDWARNRYETSATIKPANNQ